MLIAQLSDPHIRPLGCLAYGRVDTNGLLRQAVSCVAALETRPDAVVITGDLTDCGLVQEYSLLREILEELPMPFFLVPGNHDRPENLHRVFVDCWPDCESVDPMRYAVAVGAIRLVALNSVVEGKPYGELGPERLAWLDARLSQAPKRPTMVCLHHPPFSTGMVPMDRIGCRDGEQLGEIIRRHPQVERVLCGHLHRPIQIGWNGTVGCVAPSTAHQLLLDLEQDRPERLSLEPPGFLLHLWRPETGTVTHTCLTGDFGDPYMIELDPEYPAYEAD